MKKGHAILRSLTETFGSSADILVPRVCPICGTALTGAEDLLCMSCLMAVPRTYIHRLAACKLADRMLRHAPGCRAASWFHYSHGSDYAQLILDLKYRDMPRLGSAMGAAFARELQADGFLDAVDAIVPVPLHWLRKLRRGYNQSELIARGVAEVCGAEVVTGVLKARAHRSQTRYDRDERSLNANRHIYYISNPSLLHGRNVLLVDDIATTGSTLEACVSVIARTCQPASIRILTLGLTENQ